MLDEQSEMEKKNIPFHEFAETPLGSYASDSSKAHDAEQSTASEQVHHDESQTDSLQEEASEKEQQAGATMDNASSTQQEGIDYSGTFKSLNVGDLVDGVVVHIDREGVLVDVGTKSEGTIKPDELSRDPSLSPEEVVSVGEKIKVYVVEPESQEGGPVLSKKRADFENAWERVEKAYQEGSTLRAMVTDRVKGGLVVDLGIRGFVPASHVGGGNVRNLDRYIGQSLPFKVIEVDREHRKVVLSNRLAIEEEQKLARERTLASLVEGQIREGVVRRITDFGAFVDLGGGVDGLLHKSEMSWTRINHPSDVVKVGQKINVMILKLNLEQGRVSLGLRQILPDPWEEIKQLYQVGDIISGTISRIVPFGAFVQVAGGVEGIVPTSEMAYRRVNNPEEVVSVGQSVEVKVIDIRPDERRLTLSLRQAQAEREREREQAVYEEYTQSKAEEGRTTIGDLIGHQLDKLGVLDEKEEKQSRKLQSKEVKKRLREEAETLAEAEEEKLVETELEVEDFQELQGEAVEDASEPQVDTVEGSTLPESDVGEVEQDTLSEPEEKPDANESRSGSDDAEQSVTGSE
ncbi:MAG: 30S ribosomal protein S1 [Armatimonadota bacterium]